MGDVLSLPGGRVGQALKRLLDLLLAGLLLLLLAPLMVAIALVILLRDGRPVLYRESRLGRQGSVFTLYKFRTLQPGSAGASSIAPDGDARVSQLGRGLRRWRFDELPQLVNVLLGDMSLVGPRPLSRSHADTLTAATRSALLMVRPGLSSPAALAFLADDEVLGDRADAEAVYLERLLPAKAALDLEYVENWSLTSDLRIALSTLFQVWSRRYRDRSAELVRGLLERR